MKYVYPVIFTQTEHEILIEVPDLDILTQAYSISEALDMARDAIGLKAITLEDEKMEIPLPSDWKNISLSKSTFSADGESNISLVDVDFVEYRRKNDNKSVRRNVTLPNWLNLEAEKAHLNVSKVLREALMSELKI